MRITEDSVWRYYNCPDERWSRKCRLCRAKVESERAPVEECVNCWKVEIWKHGKAFGEEGIDSFDCLMDALEVLAPTPVIAKASRAAIQVVRSGLPEDGYPDQVVDDLLVLYAQSIAEREWLRGLVQSALRLTDEAAARIPIRRGCWRFDDVLGPWQGWYAVNADWTNKIPGDPPGCPSGDRHLII